MTTLRNNSQLAATAAIKALKGRPDVKQGCNPCDKTQAIAANRPANLRGGVVNDCKSIVYKNTNSLKPCARRAKTLLILLALCAIATTARAQVTVIHDNVKYVLYNDGTAYVDLSPGAWGTLNLRETVSYNSLTCTVTRIADGAFFNNKQITGNLVIPNTVTHIGKDAFSGCSGLNGTLTLPESLQTIGNTAFYQCTGLTGQLNLPATLTSIGSSAFMDCTGFSGSLTLPPLLTEIKDQTFYGIQFTGDLVVPDGVTSIGDEAFYLNKFSSITIGNGVTTIGHYAFRLTAADQLTLGSSVATIGDEAFRYYDEGSHDHINIKCLNAVPAALGENVFQNHKEWLVEVPCGARDAYVQSSGWALGGVLIPQGYNITVPRIKVAKLSDSGLPIYYLLNPCDHTATVTHSGYTENNEYNNSYPRQTRVPIPSTVEHEGEIYRVTRIGAYAFRGCSELAIIEIGDYVEYIGNGAFSMTNKLAFFTCYNPVPPILDADVFYSSNPTIYHLSSLTVPCGSVEAYRNASQWSSFKNFGTLDFKAKVEINGVYYVLNCDGTATVTHAGYSEDDSNSGSYSGYVVIPGTVTYKGETHVVNRIGNNAFKGCVSLTDAIIGENVENIGNNAFEGCTALSVISSQRPEPPALGSNVFSGVPTTAVLKVSCTATEAYAAAAQWQDFNIQGTVLAYINAQIDGVYYVLNPCRGTATVTHAGYDEVANAHYMNSYPDAVAITIPETVTHEGATYDVTRIGNYAFLFSNSLTSIVIGEKVGYVGEDAFGGCSGLQSITSKNPTPPTLGWSGNVFQQVPTTAVLYVPCSAVETYAATGGWNRFETIRAELYQVEGLYYQLCGGTATVAGHPSYATTLTFVNIDSPVSIDGTDYDVTGIEAGAFDGCTELQSFDCHFALTELGDHTFRNCTSLEYLGLYQTDTPPALGEDVFDGLDINTMWLMVPYCSQYDYSQHATWGQFGEIHGNGSCEYNFTNAAGDKLWSNPANWTDANYAPCTEAPGAGARVAILEDCEIGADVTVGSVTIGNYYEEDYGLYERLTVKSGNTLTATDFIYTTGDARNFIIEDGAQVYHPNAGAQATVEKNITAYTPNTKDGYHLIGHSFADNGAVSEMDNLLANDYDLYYYDEPTHYWMNQKLTANNFTELEAAKGYLYANSASQTIGLKGTLNPANALVNIPLSYEADALKGFNLVGNPFAHNMTTFTGTNVATEVYRMNGTKDNLMVSTISAADPLTPGEGFFVKATGENASITFNAQTRGGAKATELAEVPTITLNLTQNGLLVDRFILKRDGEPLEKFTLNENGTRIYATHGGKDYAVVTVGRDAPWHVSTTDEIPINFKAAKNGTYTLIFDTQNLDLDYLHLIDNLTGEDIDLLSSVGASTGSAAYTFEAKTTDYASRFRLVFSTPADETSANRTFAYYADGEIRLVETCHGASLQVVDALGRVIVSTGGHARYVPTAGMASGVYVLRLINGDNVRTQKIVID